MNMNDYYAQLVGYRIEEFLGVVEEEAFPSGDGFPTFILRKKGASPLKVELSRDPEGNGGGFAFIDEYQSPENHWMEKRYVTGKKNDNGDLIGGFQYGTPAEFDRTQNDEDVYSMYHIEDIDPMMEGDSNGRFYTCIERTTYHTNDLAYIEAYLAIFMLDETSGFNVDVLPKDMATGYRLGFAIFDSDRGIPLLPLPDLDGGVTTFNTEEEAQRAAEELHHGHDGEIRVCTRGVAVEMGTGNVLYSSTGSNVSLRDDYFDEAAARA